MARNSLLCADVPLRNYSLTPLLEFSPRTSADISSQSQQLQVLVEDPLVRTNDTSSALETFSDSELYKLIFYLLTYLLTNLLTYYKRQRMNIMIVWRTREKIFGSSEQFCAVLCTTIVPNYMYTYHHHHHHHKFGFSTS